jgi:DNA end-binding protein Ku
MALRPIWRGHLRLALVTCPVALYSASHDRATLRFNMINPKTGNRIKMVSQDAETGDEVARRDTVKGYEFKKDTYLILTDEDFESVRVESSSVINIDKFVDLPSIDPIYFDSSYFMGPDGDAGLDVYGVLREAIRQTGKMALARVVVNRRERVIGIASMGRGLVAHTLHEARDLNSASEVFDKLPDAAPDPEMVRLATQLIDRQAGQYDPGDFEDRYETRLREVIAAKLKGEGIETADEEEQDRGNVIDLMAALKKSLGQEAREKTPIAKTPAETNATTKRSAPKKGKEQSPEETRRQASFKLPIDGGRKSGRQGGEVTDQPAAERPASTRRKAS